MNTDVLIPSFIAAWRIISLSGGVVRITVLQVIEEPRSVGLAIGLFCNQFLQHFDGCVFVM